MGAKNTIHTVITIIGFVVIALSIFADMLGIGSVVGLGPAQIIGIVAGLIIVIVGYILKPKEQSEKSSE